MGEYAQRKSDDEEIKIGVCDSLFYLRLEDVDKVRRVGISLNPATADGVRFRLPYPDEDDIKPGDYDEGHRGARFELNFTLDGIEDNPGTFQMVHPSGLLASVPCYHGAKLPDLGDARAFWNGKSWFLELVAVKRTEGKIIPIVGCRHCQNQWRVDWDDVLDHLVSAKLAERLAVHRA